MNEQVPVTFTSDDKKHLDWVYTLHKYGVPVFAVALVSSFLWWRSKYSGATFS